MPDASVIVHDLCLMVHVPEELAWRLWERARMSEIPLAMSHEPSSMHSTSSTQHQAPNTIRNNKNAHRIKQLNIQKQNKLIMTVRTIIFSSDNQKLRIVSCSEAQQIVTMAAKKNQCPQEAPKGVPKETQRLPVDPEFET